MTRIVLIRHAQSIAVRDLPEADWPLSERGREQAQRLVEVLRGLDISAVVASPYRRAVDTVRPFAEGAGQTIHIEPDIRERRLGPAWVEDIEAVIDTIHGDPHARMPGGESAHEARARFEAGLASIAARWPGRSVAVASHGAVIAHLLRHDHRELPADYHRRIRNPHLFELEWGEPRRWISETTLDGEPGVGWPRAA